jgi:hypothetical protein
MYCIAMKISSLQKEKELVNLRQKSFMRLTPGLMLSLHKRLKSAILCSGSISDLNFGGKQP